MSLGLGGNAGARPATKLGILVGCDVLLRRVKDLVPDSDSEKVRVLGMDNFASSKGNACGTLLVDLERHKVVDLLAERSTESTVNWLRGHLSVEIVSRDRSNV